MNAVILCDTNFSYSPNRRPIVTAVGGLLAALSAPLSVVRDWYGPTSPSPEMSSICRRLVPLDVAYHLSRIITDSKYGQVGDTMNKPYLEGVLAILSFGGNPGRVKSQLQRNAKFLPHLLRACADSA
jgi:hypothetical protein